MIVTVRLAPLKSFDILALYKFDYYYYYITVVFHIYVQAGQKQPSHNRCPALCTELVAAYFCSLIAFMVISLLTRLAQGRHITFSDTLVCL